MKIEHGDIDIVEQLCVVFDGVTAGEENNNLLLHVALEESEQEEEPSI